MTNLLLHGYYYRYREKRKQIKNQLIDIGNYAEAKTQLETAIAEHLAKFPDSDSRRDFNFGEKIMMKHSLNHLTAVIDKNDPIFIDGDLEGTPIIKHQSDTVKSALLHVPKTSYTL